jgi:antitoxin ParD1/3/4
MPNVEKISIALPPEMVSMVREAVEAGEYSSSSEVVREALREWSHKRSLREKGLDELRRVRQQALEDDSPGVSPHDVFERLERKYQAIADAAGEQKECA